MTTNAFNLGLRVLGGKATRRRIIDHAVAFNAYAQCDARAEIEKEAYLSFFVFDNPFKDHFERNNSEAGYDGPCGADWLWFDLDRPADLQAALRDARGLAGVILDEYRDYDDDDLLIFLSGGKGVHVGLPTVWNPEPSRTFHRTAKAFCLALAERAGVVVDSSIYSKTRIFRAPNSRHPKTGLFKRRLSLDELTYLSVEKIVELAREAAPFDIPKGPTSCERAAEDWARAGQSVERQTLARAARIGDGPRRLNALTLDFIREGATNGERHNRLFQAAANLAELGCNLDLAEALLTESGRDSGLPPKEVSRQIRSGFDHARRNEGGVE